MKELVQNKGIYRRAIFFEAVTSAHQHFFQKKYIFNNGAYSKEAIFQNIYSLEKVKFAEKKYSALPTLSGEPVGIYMFKVNNINTTARCEIRSKLTIKTPGRR